MDDSRTSRRLTVQHFLLSVLLIALLTSSVAADPLAPNLGPRPAPAEITTIDGCAPDGDGGDPALNLAKNRVDPPSTPYAATVSQLLALPSPIGKQDRSTWTTVQHNVVAAYEGTPLFIEGYLLAAKVEGPESPNCHGTGRDFHVFVGETPTALKSRTVVVEITPRVHPKAWTIAMMRGLMKSREKVRITGWLLYDQEHPNEVGKSRGTVWEVHPVTGLEVWRGGKWVAL